MKKKILGWFIITTPVVSAVSWVVLSFGWKDLAIGAIVVIGLIVVATVFTLGIALIRGDL